MKFLLPLQRQSVAAFSALCFFSLLSVRPLFATPTDFNGDGINDILYRSTADLTWRLDTMNANQVTDTSAMNGMSTCCGWLFNGSGDFNADGRNDVIIRNTSSGAWYIYNISNNSIIDRGYVGIEDATVVAVQAVADFNQDGYADVLLRNEQTGAWTMTLLNNRTIVEEITPPMSQVLTWRVVDVQDFDGNGSPDILIRNSQSGAWYIYLYSGTEIINRGYITTILPTDLQEEVQAVADFNGDGNADLLLRNLASNQWSLALMDGKSPRELASLNINSTGLWELNASNDYNADGYADISLRAKSTEQLYAYFLNGSNILSQGYINATLPEDMRAASLRTLSTPALIAGESVAVFNDSSQTEFNNNISSIVDSKCIACHVSGGLAGQSGLVFTTSTTANFQALNRNVLEAFVAANGSAIVLSKVTGGSDHPGGVQLTVDSSDYANLSNFIGLFNIASATDNSPENSAPIANAGADQTVTGGAQVTLDGSASSDADNDNLTYLWRFSSRPNNSDATLSGATSSSPTFTADQIGSYVVSLTVNDGTVNSQSDTVTITAANNNIDITDAQFSNRSGDCRQYVGTYFSNVTDVKQNLNYNGNVTISANDSACTLAVNEVPNHDFNDDNARFPANVSEQNGNYSIPVSPNFANRTTQLTLGIVNVVTLNGVVVDLLAAACYDVGNEPLGSEKTGCGTDQINNPWRYDPMSSLNNFGTDSHNAHTQPDGTYHYHGDPLAMYDLNCETAATASPVIGFAADGFPVYGPCFTDPTSGTVRKAASSFQLKSGVRQDETGYTTPETGNGAIASNNYDGQFRGDYEYVAGSGDLDECNGMTVNGQYGYYLTNAFPWVLACYKGSVDSSFSKVPSRAQQTTLNQHKHLNQHAHSADGHSHY